MKHEVRFFPAWHRVADDPKKDYGVHGVEIHFIASDPLGAVIFRIFTNWMLPETVRWWRSRRIDGRRAPDEDPIDAGLVFHSARPMYEGHERSQDDCPYIGKPCYQDVGFLLSREPMELLRREGDEALWMSLDLEHASRFANPEAQPRKEITMREITEHRVNPANDTIRIHATDEPGAGGANHHYMVTTPDWTRGPDGSDAKGVWDIQFQDGPIAENGVNGITQEVLLAIVADRLRCFQAGPYACAENAEALTHVEDAQRVLQARTKARMGRGVEGTSTV